MSEWSIQPLAKLHDRSGFDCGVEPLNRYLSQQAGQDVRRRTAAVYVASKPGGNAVAGYYTLSAATVRMARLPDAVARRLPRYPEIPAFLIGRLAVSSEGRGGGLGRVLLADALKRCLGLSDEVGAALVLVDAKDESAAAFYRHFEFQDLDGKRLFLPLAVAAKALGFQAGR